MINLFLFRLTHIRRAMARLIRLDGFELGLALTFALFVLAIMSAAGGAR